MNNTPEVNAGQTDPNVARIIRAAVTWVDLARANGYGGEGWVPTDADIWHSALLCRLLAGNDPLPQAPPRAYSYPWYELVEKGCAYFIPERFSEWFESGSYPGHLILCQNPEWEIVRHLDPGFVLTHPGAPGTWELRPLRDDEDHPSRGTTVENGPPEPIPATWVLCPYITSIKPESP